ncbi:MAG: lysophospholipid acyltransferase family protein [Candidatus Azobacteroides sp.]|nr:lysophospholipid acyltransferase family protein [Candidatus Azobacteroides sp.]
MYYILYTFVYLHALLPFCLLYVLSDILFLILYKMIGYRKKVVRENLMHAFPEKSQKEIRELESRFYRHFTDYIVETMKLAHISDKEMKKRMVFKNVDELNGWLADGKSCILLLGHYGNWEWIPSVCLYLNKNLLTGQIYHPLNNKAFDKLLLKLRGRFGSVSIPMNQTLREIVRMKKENIQNIIGFISDQRPLWKSIEYWTVFLNQDTPMISGFERLAKQSDAVVVYLDIIKTRRGHYEAVFRLITAIPKECKEFSITEEYAREMERTILRDPAYWLWTHKRWKYKKEVWLENPLKAI